MGRNRLPDRIKKIRGTDQPCRMSGVDMEYISKLPAPPKSFSKVAKKIYKTLGVSVVASKVLSPTNLPQFVAYCQEIGIYMEANEEMSSLDSRIEKSDSGRTFVSGTQRVAALALQNALKLGREFGFTPATVNKITTKVNNQADDFDRFLNS